MEKIKCPLEPFKDKEVPLYIIFDTLSMRTAQQVGCVFIYLINNKDSKATKVIENIIKANINRNRFELIKRMYFDTYDFKNKKLKRYFYFKEPNTIFDIMDSFEIIFNLIPLLQNIASYYK